MRALTVSILSRPEGRLQPAPRSGGGRGTSRFNPQPPRRAAATYMSTPRGVQCEVSILSRPEGRLQRRSSRRAGPGARSFNPQPPRRAAATSPGRMRSIHPHVSILSRPEGRLQHALPVQLLLCGGFQSSAAPKGGCNPRRGGSGVGTDHEPVSILSRPEGRLQPVKQEDPPPAGGLVSILSRPEGRLQRGLRGPRHLAVDVSILSRPEGRLQPPAPRSRSLPEWVSILSRPEGRLQPGGPTPSGAGGSGFNPQPPRRAAATLLSSSLRHPRLRFNPQPPRRAAATRNSPLPR